MNTLYKQALDTDPDSIAIIDTNFRIIYQNPNLSTFLGRTPEDIIGKLCYQVLHDLGRPPVNCPLGSHPAGQLPASHEFDGRDGCSLMITVSRVEGADGQAAGCIFRARDRMQIKAADPFEHPACKEMENQLTRCQAKLSDTVDALAREIVNRHEAEKLIKKTGERLALALEASEEGFWDWNLTSPKAYFSPRCYTMLGYRTSEIGNEIDTWLKLIHPDDNAGVHHQLDACVTDHKDQIKTEFRMKTKDGRWRWIMAKCRVFERDQDGRAKRIVGTRLDITPQKTAEHKRNESERLFRALVEHSPFGISIWQADELVFMNPTLKTIMGSAHQGIMLKDLPVHSDDRGTFEHFWSMALSGAAPSNGSVFRVMPAAGKDEPDTARWVSCSTVSIEYNRQPALLCSMVDVTRSRELEKLALIREKMASLGHAAAGIAHEIRNPLSGINVFLDGIRDNFEIPDSADEIKEMIDEARGAANKIEAVIKRVLDFARPTASKLVLADIHTPIREAEKLCRTTLRNAGVKMRWELMDRPPDIHIDAQLIEQVVVNLLVNAVNAMPADADDKIIRIATRRTHTHIVLTVSDSGTGVDEKNKNAIFEPFFTTRSDGSGVGLSLSQRIIAHHGGTIEVGASEFGGARFKIQLPMEKRMGPR